MGLIQRISSGWHRTVRYERDYSSYLAYGINTKQLRALVKTNFIFGILLYNYYSNLFRCLLYKLYFIESYILIFTILFVKKKTMEQLKVVTLCFLCCYFRGYILLGGTPHPPPNTKSACGLVVLQPTHTDHVTITVVAFTNCIEK